MISAHRTYVEIQLLLAPEEARAICIALDTCHADVLKELRSQLRDQLSQIYPPQAPAKDN